MKVSREAQVTGAPHGVTEAVVSPNRECFAYWAKTKSGFLCITNHSATKGLSSDSVISESITFSPDSQRLAIGVVRDTEQAFVVDGIQIMSHKAIGNGTATFSPDSKRFAYAAETDLGKRQLILDGRAGPTFDGILGAPVFSPDSLRAAIAGRRQSEIFVWVDGVLRGPFDAISDGVIIQTPTPKLDKPSVL